MPTNGSQAEKATGRSRHVARKHAAERFKRPVK
jgi:hypothetical protein